MPNEKVHIQRKDDEAVLCGLSANAWLTAMIDFSVEKLCPQCVSQASALLTQRAADEAYCTANCVDDPNKVGWLFCPYCGKRLHR